MEPTVDSARPAAISSNRMTVRALRLKDEQFPDFWKTVDPDWDYQDFYRPEASHYHHGQISFDCILADDVRDIIWCGIATFSGEIFYGYDRRTRSFRNMNYRQVGDRFDAKFHRALTFDNEGKIWAATAMLHDPPQYFDAPGGAIVHFDPETEAVSIFDRPFPHVYIQSIVLDRERRILYGQTYTPEYVFRYDIDQKSGRYLAHLGQNGGGGAGGLYQCEQLALDRTGAVWGAWGVNRAWGHSLGKEPYRLLRYHPDEDQVDYLDLRLRHPETSAGAKVDSMATGPDGNIYVSIGAAWLYRIDVESKTVEVIGQVGSQSGQRLSALKSHKGKLYGVCGKGGIPELISYCPTHGALTNHGPLYDEEANVSAYQIHDITITADGTIYAGENDVPHRSSFLWEIQGVISE